MSLLTDLQTLREHLDRTIGADGSAPLDEKKGKGKASKFVKALTKGRSDIENPQGLGGFIKNAKSHHLAQWAKKKKKGKKS